MKIIEVTFPPTVGYKTGKTYAYVTDDPNAEDAKFAVVQDPQGFYVITNVKSVREYRPQFFKMKHAVKIITLADLKSHASKKEM